MMTNIFIKNFLIKIVNASIYKKQKISINYSFMYINFLKSLKFNGFIRSFVIKKKNNKIWIFLKYDYFLNPSINSLKMVSKVKKLTNISNYNINSIFKDFNAVCSNDKKNKLYCNISKKNFLKQKSQCLILLK